MWFSAALKKKGVTVKSMFIGGSAPKPAPARKVVKKAARKTPAKRAAKK